MTKHRNTRESAGVWTRLSLTLHSPFEPKKVEEYVPRNEYRKCAVPACTVWFRNTENFFQWPPHQTHCAQHSAPALRRGIRWEPATAEGEAA